MTDFQLSFEFFPPRSPAGMESLVRVSDRLAETQPTYCSCTYGAGGSTRDGTLETIRMLLERGVDAAPHLSIGADDQSRVFELLDQYRDLGVRRIVALRGDVPSGAGRTRFIHNAETLVTWIREHSGDHFHLEVAAYPEVHPDAAGPDEDLEYFKRKVDAGANAAITQYFFHPYAYLDFLERCDRAGIGIPIVPGIMPITNREGLLRFSDKCGADVPRWIDQRLAAFGDDEAGIRAFGIEVLSRLCEDLLRYGAPGLHFYTLNRWGASLAICRNLGLPGAADTD